MRKRLSAIVAALLIASDGISVRASGDHRHHHRRHRRQGWRTASRSHGYGRGAGLNHQAHGGHRCDRHGRPWKRSRRRASTRSTASLQGFTDLTREQIRVVSGQTFTLNLTLQVAGLTEDRSGHGDHADRRRDQHHHQPGRHPRADRVAADRPLLSVVPPAGAGRSALPPPATRRLAPASTSRSQRRRRISPTTSTTSKAST